MGKSSLYPEQRLRRRVAAWALKLEVNPTQIIIRPMTDKWGSCGPDGIVVLADDLATAEPDVQDYVIVHELLHLTHRGHGRVFRALLETNVPAWRTAEHSLRATIIDGREVRKR
jgi:hypothetical protein